MIFQQTFTLERCEIERRKRKEKNTIDRIADIDVDRWESTTVGERPLL